MGQQLAVPTGFNVDRKGFVFPPWYFDSNFDTDVVGTTAIIM